MCHIRTKLKMLGYWISQISWAHSWYPLWKQEAESWDCLVAMERYQPVHPQAPIMAAFGTGVHVATSYPADLEEATGLLHSQPRAAVSRGNCTGLAANSYLGELGFFLVRTASCFLHVSRAKVAHQLPGEESNGVARQGPKRTQQKPGFLSNYHQSEKPAAS